MNADNLKSLKLYEIFSQTFDKESRDAACMAAYLDEHLKGQFKQPAHTYLVSYMAAVALKAPPAVQEVLFEAFIEELQNQGKVVSAEWQTTAKQVVQKTVDEHLASPGVNDTYEHPAAA